MLHLGAAVALIAFGIFRFAKVPQHDKLGVRILRKSWVNSDYLWAASFVAAGAITLVT